MTNKQKAKLIDWFQLGEGTDSTIGHYYFYKFETATECREYLESMQEYARDELDHGQEDEHRETDSLYDYGQYGTHKKILEAGIESIEAEIELLPTSGPFYVLQPDSAADRCPYFIDVTQTAEELVELFDANEIDDAYVEVFGEDDDE